MTDSKIHPFPGWLIELRWEAQEEIPSEPGLAAIAITALEALRDVVVPLSADLELVCAEPQTRSAHEMTHPAIQFLHLRATALPDGVFVMPMFQPSQISEAPKLDRVSIQDWIETGLNQTCEAGRTTAWAALWIESVCACVEDTSVLAEAGTNGKVTLQSESGPIEFPLRVIDNTFWVCGPLPSMSTEPPIRVTFFNDGGVISLKIHVHFSWWTEPGSPGRRKLQECIDQILREGWQQIFTDI